MRRPDCRVPLTMLPHVGRGLITRDDQGASRDDRGGGRHLGRPGTPPRVVSEIETLATTTDLSVRAIQKKIAGRTSRGIVGEITKRARAGAVAA